MSFNYDHCFGRRKSGFKTNNISKPEIIYANVDPTSIKQAEIQNNGTGDKFIIYKNHKSNEIQNDKKMSEKSEKAIKSITSDKLYSPAYGGNLSQNVIIKQMPNKNSFKFNTINTGKVLTDTFHSTKTNIELDRISDDQVILKKQNTSHDEFLLFGSTIVNNTKQKTCKSQHDLRNNSKTTILDISSSHIPIRITDNPFNRTQINQTKSQISTGFQNMSYNDNENRRTSRISFNDLNLNFTNEDKLKSDVGLPLKFNDEFISPINVGNNYTAPVPFINEPTAEYKTSNYHSISSTIYSECGLEKNNQNYNYSSPKVSFNEPNIEVQETPIKYDSIKENFSSPAFKNSEKRNSSFSNNNNEIVLIGDQLQTQESFKISSVDEELKLKELIWKLKEKIHRYKEKLNECNAIIVTKPNDEFEEYIEEIEETTITPLKCQHEDLNAQLTYSQNHMALKELKHYTNISTDIDLIEPEFTENYLEEMKQHLRSEILNETYTIPYDSNKQIFKNAICTNVELNNNDNEIIREWFNDHDETYTLEQRSFVEHLFQCFDHNRIQFVELIINLLSKSVKSIQTQVDLIQMNDESTNTEFIKQISKGVGDNFKKNIKIINLDQMVSCSIMVKPDMNNKYCVIKPTSINSSNQTESDMMHYSIDTNVNNNTKTIFTQTISDSLLENRFISINKDDYNDDSDDDTNTINEEWITSSIIKLDQSDQDVDQKWSLNEIDQKMSLSNNNESFKRYESHNKRLDQSNQQLSLNKIDRKLSLINNYDRELTQNRFKRYESRIKDSIDLNNDRYYSFHGDGYFKRNHGDSNSRLYSHRYNDRFKESGSRMRDGGRGYGSYGYSRRSYYQPITYNDSESSELTKFNNFMKEALLKNGPGTYYNKNNTDEYENVFDDTIITSQEQYNPITTYSSEISSSHKHIY